MAHDEDIEIEPAPEMAADIEMTPAPARARSGGRLVVAGVVGACALGVGLGLWARPAAHERQFYVAPKEEAKPEPLPTRILEIVIDDSPAPIGALMDVMPAGTPGMATSPQPPPVPAQPLAPRPSPTGLMRVDTPVVTVEPPPVVKPVLKVIEAQPEPEPPKPIVKAVAKPKAEVKAEAKPKPDIKVARKAEPKKVAKAEPKPKKAEKAKLAKAEPKPKKAEKVQKAEAKKKPSSLVRLARAVKADAAKVEKKIEKKIAKAEKPQESRKAKLARLKAEKRQADLAKAKARKIQLAKAEAVKPKKAKPVPRGTGPMRVAKADRCASADPGEAAVCADPRLTSRDRQMQVAYRNAEAAGVPASALRRQQQRWVAARAAAAREAPWAVEDVYQARIAELNDLAKDAGPY